MANWVAGRVGQWMGVAECEGGKREGLGDQVNASMQLVVLCWCTWDA